MRLLILSDLHGEFGFETPKDLELDVALLADDFYQPGERAVQWVLWSEAQASKHVIFVTGIPASRAVRRAD
jgi:hypothetical protein